MRIFSLKITIIALLAGLLIASVVYPQELAGEYVLDSASRDVSPTGELVCPDVPLVNYRGTSIRYTQTARVHPAFTERLGRFEQVVAETAVTVFGREPQYIVQKGSYYCRRIRSIPSLISEHSLGNAVDVYAFKFAPLPKGNDLPAEVPKQFKRAFTVSLLKHWEAKSTSDAYHSKFLKLLVEKLVNRQDIFTVLLGPAYPGHKNHFHFDRANYSLVSI